MNTCIRIFGEPHVVELALSLEPLGKEFIGESLAKLIGATEDEGEKAAPPILPLATKPAPLQDNSPG